MSFGYSIGDAIVLTQLAWKTVQNARKACGKYHELTHEVLSLHVVLRRLEDEVKKPEITFSGVRSGESDSEELQVIVNGCRWVLSILDQVLTKYNALGEQERSGRKLWQKIKFGNGKMADLAEMRARLTYYTSAMSLFLNMVSMGTMGRVERQMNNTGGDLKEIKAAVNGITAHLMSSSNRHEGSVLTAHADDDRAVWKEFRRELLEDGFSSSVIRKHKRLIKAYIEELGSRGLFDEEDPNMDVEEHCCDVDSPVEQATAYNPETENVPEASSEIVSEIESEVESVVESPVVSTPQPDFDIEPYAASHSETESSGKERPLDVSIPDIASQPKPQPEMRWFWLRNDIDRESQSYLAEKKRKPTKMDKMERYEDTIRLLHDMWHELYDDIVQRFIEWGVLPFHERRQIDLSTLVDRVSQLRADIKSVPVPEPLFSIWLIDLLLEIDYIGEVMKEHQKDSSLSNWTDERCGKLGYHVRFGTAIHTISQKKDVYVVTGARFCCQLDANGVCRQGEQREEPRIESDRSKSPWLSSSSKKRDDCMFTEEPRLKFDGSKNFWLSSA